jgi:hypothetical protein
MVASLGVVHRTGDPPAGGRAWWSTDARARITVVAAGALIREISQDAPGATR